MGESMKASSGLRCASGRKAFRAHTFIALVTLSLQRAWHATSAPLQFVGPRVTLLVCTDIINVGLALLWVPLKQRSTSRRALKESAF